MATRRNDRHPYFAHNIRQLRMTFSMSQDELAKSLKIPSAHGGAIVSGWERGEREPSLVMVCEIADFFGVSLDWLLGRENRTPFRDQVYTLLVRGEDQLSTEERDRLLKVIEALIN